jgi:hypothetical protein
VQYDASRVEKEGNIMAFMNLYYKHHSITVAKYGLVRDRSERIQYFSFSTTRAPRPHTRISQHLGVLGVSAGAPAVLKFAFRPPWVNARR